VLVVPGAHRNSISSLRNKGFSVSRGVEPLAAITVCGTRRILRLFRIEQRNSDCEQRYDSRSDNSLALIASIIIVAVGWSLRSLDSLRVGMREGENRRTDCLRTDPARKMELSEIAL
jgi:hypothetical protein